MYCENREIANLINNFWIILINIILINNCWSIKLKKETTKIFILLQLRMLYHLKGILFVLSISKTMMQQWQSIETLMITSPLINLSND